MLKQFQEYNNFITIVKGFNSDQLLAVSHKNVETSPALSLPLHGKLAGGHQLMADR